MANSTLNRKFQMHARGQADAESGENKEKNQFNRLASDIKAAPAGLSLPSSSGGNRSREKPPAAVERGDAVAPDFEAVIKRDIATLQKRIESLQAIELEYMISVNPRARFVRAVMFGVAFSVAAYLSIAIPAVLLGDLPSLMDTVVPISFAAGAIGGIAVYGLSPSFAKIEMEDAKKARLVIAHSANAVRKTAKDIAEHASRIHPSNVSAIDTVFNDVERALAQLDWSRGVPLSERAERNESVQNLYSEPDLTELKTSVSLLSIWARAPERRSN